MKRLTGKEALDLIITVGTLVGQIIVICTSSLITQPFK